mmetsp:Transcript_2974/g.4141  ORF Transcript_2974/g.4141 Transcript_2974/m.4141 type:complete len:297 (+) Transcript_2974:77-967(+)|eukprot:CAMPEP_0201102490 /NCGR_PEP_ID=MMETSP0812-20130820/17830_1 /ASSEMBLY_ACC=CAM_ASM_000668 /TAXON_ID=98059 /ORGANISM="Dinobryon sp., Strain UTEXLB2267" /LENGTH=296 /DNA_ID=CAMNT_0047360021 /DNA_START=45 /DNA_END=935 /DNA_ORIENTATION=+
MYPPYQNQNKQAAKEDWYTTSAPHAQPPTPHFNPPLNQAPYQPNPANYAMNQMQMAGVSPDMINLGLHAGKDMLRQQADRWSPGFSSTWASLKYYFQVNNTYVKSKILRILYPIRIDYWKRFSSDEIAKDESTESLSSKWAPPSLDINGPDLYIPLMSFITYVLLYGLSRASSITTFTPEILIQAIWRGLMLQLLETGIIKFGVNMMSGTVPFLDIFSYTGYKYVGLCINIATRVLGGSLNFVVSLYTASMLGYFFMKTMAAAVPDTGMNNGPPRLLCLIAFAALQFVVVFILSWL